MKGLPCVILLCLAGAAGAQERTVQKLHLQPLPNGPEVEIWLTRARGPEGELTVRLVERGVGRMPQSLTLYKGGGGDDSPGDDDLKALRGTVMELPGGRQVARIDLTLHPPAGKAGDEQTETTLVGFAGPKTHKVLTIKTRIAREMSKWCREVAEVALEPGAPAADGSFELTAVATRKAEAALDDEDQPIDPDCRAPAGEERKQYRFDGTRLLPAPPAPTAPVAAAPPAADSTKAPSPDGGTH